MQLYNIQLILISRGGKKLGGLEVLKRCMYALILFFFVDELIFMKRTENVISKVWNILRRIFMAKKIENLS